MTGSLCFFKLFCTFYDFQNPFLSKLALAGFCQISFAGRSKFSLFFKGLHEQWVGSWEARAAITIWINRERLVWVLLDGNGIRWAFLVSSAFVFVIFVSSRRATISWRDCTLSPSDFIIHATAFIITLLPFFYIVFLLLCRCAELFFEISLLICIQICAIAKSHSKSLGMGVLMREK